MTLVAALALAGAVVAVFGGVVSWVARTTVMNRLDSLETSREGMGRRFGDGQHELDKRVAILEDRSKRT